MKKAKMKMVLCEFSEATVKTLDRACVEIKKKDPADPRGRSRRALIRSIVESGVGT